jgi:soluble lytic murein transglycosylase
LRLAELLSTGPVPPERAEESLVIARRAMAKALADPALAEWAKRIEAQALQALPPEERIRRTRPSAAEELARVEALVDNKDSEEAKTAADALLAAIGRDPAQAEIACKTELARGRALAGLRQWGVASERLGDAAGHCKDPDVRARQLFLAGKYAEADKRYTQAIRHYETLQKDLPSHRLADDARLRAAQSYSELGAESQFTELLSRMADDFPGGDMVLDGMFQLALHRIKKSDWSGAAHVLERAAQEAAAQDAKRGTEFAGRERYYRARAWGVLGDQKKSLDEFEAIVRELPLSYYMLHAYSRLAKSDGERAARALSQSLENAAAAPFEFERRPEFDSPGFPRALELLRVGDVERASRELNALGLIKADAAPQLLWAIALLYERAGASKLSNGVARGLLTDWLGRWPSGDWKRAWEVAFPRPYRQIVVREAARAKVPEHLIYAIMREESSFDPAAESPAKAYGLMQVIEPTARPYGAALGVRIDSLTLKRPSVSIAVGSRVLAQLSKTFSDNPLLAIPGYNAGPRPPRRWAEAHPAIDFDVWVELIPYLETRRYTKRVLASRAAYAFLYSSIGADESVKLPVELATRLP